MLERLGHVLGWTGNVLAVVAILIGGFLSSIAMNTEYKVAYAAAGLVAASVLWAIGRALRYIFAGPSQRR